ncbi:unnamed protein product [Meloidogyne enterolobii]|uniref:Uncharacterized protein n=1 Tax=Meloidogyne enterolobii TaxID=390850 RepID=A0ACB1AXA0_MELEN
MEALIPDNKWSKIRHSRQKRILCTFLNNENIKNKIIVDNCENEKELEEEFNLKVVEWKLIENQMEIVKEQEIPQEYCYKYNNNSLIDFHLLQKLPYEQTENNEKQEELFTNKLLELIEELEDSSSKENEEMAIKIILKEINEWAKEFNCLLNKEFILGGSHLLGGKINKSDIDSILIIHEEIGDENNNLIKCPITSFEFFGPEFVDCQNLENGCGHLNKSLYCRFCGYSDV